MSYAHEEGIHLCEVCQKPTTIHRQPPWGIDHRWIPPCCKGCGCGSNEEMLANASSEEKELAREYYEGD